MRKFSSHLVDRAAKKGFSPSRSASGAGTATSTTRWATLQALPHHTPSPTAQGKQQECLSKPAHTIKLNNLGLTSASGYGLLPTRLAACRVFSTRGPALGTGATAQGEPLLEANRVTDDQIEEYVADLDLNENQEGGNAALPPTDTITQLDEKSKDLQSRIDHYEGKMESTQSDVMREIYGRQALAHQEQKVEVARQRTALMTPASSPATNGKHGDLDLNENQEGGNAALPSTDTITQLDEDLKKIEDDKREVEQAMKDAYQEKQGYLNEIRLATGDDKRFFQQQISVLNGQISSASEHLSTLVKLKLSIMDQRTTLMTPAPAPATNGDFCASSNQNFGLDHILSIKYDGKWVNVNRGFTFTGRCSFVDFVASEIGRLQEKGPEIQQETTSLIYSSVSGTGKTISMLSLKNNTKIQNSGTGDPVAVAYLGFNVRLGLNAEELRYIEGHDPFIALENILARRLVASTIISLENPEVVSALPRYEDVYEGYHIPSAKESFRTLLDYMDKKGLPILYIIAGVDEVQVLNGLGSVEGTGYGRLFLRLLRSWQVSLYSIGDGSQSIRILPLGTGVSIKFLTADTEGANIVVQGDDATLISKHDFRQLAETAVEHVISTGKLDQWFSSETSIETIINSLTVAYWPRVRLLEWWRNGDHVNLLHRRRNEEKTNNWTDWFCVWLRDEQILISGNEDLLPGNGNDKGEINALFTGGANSGSISVIPDGHQSTFLLGNLKEKLPLGPVYSALDVIDSMQPTDLFLKGAHEFEKYGFHVLSAAIHVGLHALHKATDTISTVTATDIQKKRLGSALWFRDRDVISHNKDGIPLKPRVLGNVGPSETAKIPAYFPFVSKKQDKLSPVVIDALQKSMVDCKPLHINCGTLTCCDYLYFYVRKVQESPQQIEFVCTIGDSKRTDKEQDENLESISTEDQARLFSAFELVHKSMCWRKYNFLRPEYNFPLGDVRLVFLSNKGRLSGQAPNSKSTESYLQCKREAQMQFDKLQNKLGDSLFLEVLSTRPPLPAGVPADGARVDDKNTVHGFEFGPFTDILAMRAIRE